MPRGKSAKRKNITAQVQWPTEPKRETKVNVLSLEDKISVIRHYVLVSNTRKLAEIYGVSRGQIRSILKKKEQYLAQRQGNINAKPNLKSMVRSAIHSALVHEWVRRVRNRGRLVTDKEVRLTANHVAYLINFKKFRPSPAWLYRFKNKYHLRNLGPPKKGPKQSLNVLKIFFELKSERIGEMLDKRFKKPSSEMLDEIERIALEMQQIKTRENLEDFGISSIESTTTDEDLEIDTEGDQKLDEEVSDEEVSDEEVSDEEVSDEEVFDEEGTLEPIKSYREALDQLELLGNFALSKKEFKMIELINQLEQLFLKEYFCE